MPLSSRRTDELAYNIEKNDGESLSVRDGAVVVYASDDPPSWLPPDVELLGESLIQEGEDHYLWPVIRDAIREWQR